MALALIGLGSNIGARSAQLGHAVQLLSADANVHVRAVSQWHETLPIGGPPGQSPFLNGALLLETSLAPEALFSVLADIENRLGRKREIRWQARSLDLDLLLYDDLKLQSPTLTVPHPRFAYRRFVVEPAAEIAPDLIHPVVGWSLARLRDHLRHAKPYVAIAGPAHTGKTQLADALVEHFGGRKVDSPHLPPTQPAAGSSGRALAWELELLAERGALLASRTWPDESVLAVSDFWFDQSLAYGRLRLDAGPLVELAARHRALAAGVVSPKLIIMLTPSRAELLPAERLKPALAALIGPDTGPVLQFATGDWDGLWAEVSAAVAAMS
jgi:2-amino-4-hydroxy-6-hydroxymethyldihydropteridine diphosphokinase